MVGSVTARRFEVSKLVVTGPAMSCARTLQPSEHYSLQSRGVVRSQLGLWSREKMEEALSCLGKGR